MHGDGLADDESITDELADGLARVGGRDLVDLAGVKPDLALTAADHGGGQALLSAKVDPIEDTKWSVTAVSSLPFRYHESDKISCPL